MTHPTREQIDELLRIGAMESPSAEENDRAADLCLMLAFPLARLLKAAGRDLAAILYAMRVRSDNVTPEWRERIEAVESLAALVEIGGEK